MKPLAVYWANSIFGQADQSFNDRCVTRLRKAGFAVHNPQEAAFNRSDGHASAAEIFRSDTELIVRSDVLVACIDQESIDCGVACELGIAWALNKTIIGLYTDFRQHRSGDFKMYKNPYVIGCIEERGIVVSSIEGVIARLEGREP